jgi:hypothetical protein
MVKYYNIHISATTGPIFTKFSGYLYTTQLTFLLLLAVSARVFASLLLISTGINGLADSATIVAWWDLTKQGNFNRHSTT